MLKLFKVTDESGSRGILVKERLMPIGQGAATLNVISSSLGRMSSLYNIKWISQYYIEANQKKNTSLSQRNTIFFSVKKMCSVYRIPR